MTRLGIVFGGKSGEHIVSLMSARSVINAINTEKYQPVFIGITRRGDWRAYVGDTADIETGGWEKKSTPFNPGDLKKTVDFVFPVLHGPYGEDGTIQGLFEMLDVPYAGCGVLSSAAAMDKIIAKEIFERYGLPVCNYMPVMAEELSDMGLLDRIEQKLFGKYPMFVKPANMGSSVGITKVKTRETLSDALIEAAKYDRRLIVEEGICGKELETAVLGNVKPEAAVVGEILPSAEFYDYTAKYFDGGKSEICVPAEITDEASKQIREIAVKAYEALDCAGFARVDFFLDKRTGKIYLNEINTIPGFTKFSMFPLLWQAAGLCYSGLIERIVDLGYERYHAKNNRETAIQ